MYQLATGLRLANNLSIQVQLYEAAHLTDYCHDIWWTTLDVLFAMKFGAEAWRCYFISFIKYVGYSERKYRLCISLAHPQDCHFVHVQ